MRAAPLPATNAASKALAEDLRSQISGEVRFEAGDRALYATDSSNYRQTPIGLVVPKSAEDVEAAVAICRKHEAPVLARGTGTSLAGQTCNVAVVFDFTKFMQNIHGLDPVRRLVTVEPGTHLDLINAAAKPHQLCFGPDPSTHAWCSIGGMIGNNSCGLHSIQSEFAGTGPRTSDNIEQMEVLTYDGLRMRVGATSEEDLRRYISAGGRRGEIYAGLKNLRDRYAGLIRDRFPKLLRRVSGFNLDELLPENGFNVARALAGTEGTCALTLQATLKLIHCPPVRSLVILGYPDIYSAAEDVVPIREFRPAGLEGIDDILIEGMKKKNIHPKDLQLFPDGKGWLLVEFAGHSKEEADALAKDLMTKLKSRPNPPSMCLYDAPFEEHHIWEVRESGLGASARVPGEPDTWEGWEDSAVPVDQFAAYLRGFRALLNRYNYNCTFYGHFGQGLVHTRIDFDLKSAAGVRDYERFGREAAGLVAKYRGSMSGEHGDGQSRAEFLNLMFGNELVQAFAEFKAIWDPLNRMNPGKVSGPAPIYKRDDNLRLGADYHPAQVATHFKYPDDRGSLSYALERCVGVGKCRRVSGGTMCPSYRATREEKHSTRGRARLLFEMLRGETIGAAGWRDEAVHDALDLCLACKGCKSDCPMNVDMATYKAEFLSHYYQGRIRPIAAYSMGLIYWWARLASHMPGLVNFFTQTPIFSTVFKFMGGITPNRKMPAFAAETFRAWFDRRGRVNAGCARVMLWPDTFNNFFFPETAKAAVEVLEASGHEVVIPSRILCCGRPLYDFGMLDTAKKLLRQVMATLSGDLRAGTMLVGLEPSCVSVFRDELRNLFPDDPDAMLLSKQAMTLPEFLQKHAPAFRTPALDRRALLHGHCHHKTVLDLSSEEKLLTQMGMDIHKPDSGCCGLAGSFGFERGKYEVSVSCGEMVLAPAIRAESPETLIVADGFSCREQIMHLTPRRALHVAEVMRLALQHGPKGPAGNYPERHIPKTMPAKSRSAPLLLAAGVGLVLGLAWASRNKHEA